MNGIEIDGFEDLEKYVQSMTLTEGDERAAMKSAIEPIKEEVSNSTPVKTKKLQKSIKSQVKKEGFAVAGIVRMGKFYDIFQEFGTSQQKTNAGFFERAVNKSKGTAIEILARELLDKVK